MRYRCCADPGFMFDGAALSAFHVFFHLPEGLADVRKNIVATGCNILSIILSYIWWETGETGFMIPTSETRCNE